MPDRERNQSRLRGPTAPVESRARGATAPAESRARGATAPAESRLRGPTAPAESRARGPVTGRSQGRPNDPNAPARRAQREANVAARQSALRAQQEANNPQPRPETPWASTEPRATGATTFIENQTRARIQPSRTAGFSQEEQAAILGAGSQPAQGMGPERPTMAQQWQNASPEERAAMAQSQAAQSVAPESYALGGLGALRAAQTAVRGGQAVRAGLGDISRGVSAGSSMTTRTSRVAGNRAGGRTEDLLSSPGGQAGRGATQKPRVRANPDGTFRPAGTPPPGAATTPGAAGAATTPGAAARTGFGSRVVGGLRSLGRGSAWGLGIIAGIEGLRHGKQALDNEFLDDFNAITQVPATRAEAEAVMNPPEKEEIATTTTTTTATPTTPTESAPDRNSLLRRMENGETLRQADFDAAGFDGRGITVSGDRQGTIPASLQGLRRQGGAMGGVGAGLTSREAARLNVRESLMEGLRSRASNSSESSSAPVLSVQEAEKLHNRLRRQAASEARGLTRNVSSGRAARIQAEMINSVPTVDELMRNSTTSSRSSAESLGDGFDGLRGGERRTNTNLDPGAVAGQPGTKPQDWAGEYAPQIGEIARSSGLDLGENFDSSAFANSFYSNSVARDANVFSDYGLSNSDVANLAGLALAIPSARAAWSGRMNPSSAQGVMDIIHQAAVNEQGRSVISSLFETDGGNLRGGKFKGESRELFNRLITQRRQQLQEIARNGDTSSLSPDEQRWLAENRGND